MSSSKPLSIFKGARVLITGHTGFKGSWLSLWLSELGAQVYGISLDIPSNPSHVEAAQIKERLVEDFRCDIRSLDSLEELVQLIQPDFVFHLAAQALVRKSYADCVGTWSANAMGTVNVLEALRGLKKSCTAIFITSDKSYDNQEWVWGYRETDQLGGSDPYSASKGAAEFAIKSYAHSFFPKDGNIRIGIGRAGNVIGGGDWALDRIVPDCVRAWSKSQSVQLRSPNATRPWQHVLEPLSGYLTLAIALNKSSQLHGEPFNFGPPAQQSQSVGQLVDLMGKHWNKVRWEDVSAGYSGPHESSLLKLNCDKALHYLNWEAIWDFETTVRETALWYRTYYEQSMDSITDYSTGQIELFVKDAHLKGLSWAH